MTFCQKNYSGITHNSTQGVACFPFKAYAVEKKIKSRSRLQWRPASTCNGATHDSDLCPTTPPSVLRKLPDLSAVWRFFVATIWRHLRGKSPAAAVPCSPFRRVPFRPRIEERRVGGSLGRRQTLYLGSHLPQSGGTRHQAVTLRRAEGCLSEVCQTFVVDQSGVCQCLSGPVVTRLRTATVSC